MNFPHVGCRYIYDRFLCSGRAYRDLSKVSRKKSFYEYILNQSDTQGYIFESLVFNYRRGRAYLNMNETIDKSVMIKLHELVVDDVEHRFRKDNESAWIGSKDPKKSRFMAPSASKVDLVINQLAAYLECSILDSDLLTIEIYRIFNCIHPFLDGNGRVSRLLFDVLWFKGDERFVSPVLFRLFHGDNGFVSSFNCLLKLDDTPLVARHYWKDAISWSSNKDEEARGLSEKYTKDISEFITACDSTIGDFLLENPIFTSNMLEGHSKKNSSFTSELLARLIESGILSVRPCKLNKFIFVSDWSFDVFSDFDKILLCH